MIGSEETGVIRLLGNVHFNYRGTEMFCDSAHYKKPTEEVWAYGHVHMNKQDSLNLFCDSMYFNGRKSYAKLWSHVRVRDREYKVTADTLEYDAKKAQAIYRYGGRIENITSQEVLTSRVGYFHPNTKESFFRGNVVYKSPDLKMTTDTLQYNYLRHRVYFYGPTNIDNKETKVYCERGWFDVENEEGVFQGNARIDQEPRIIHGDSLYYHAKQKIAIGRGHVTVLDTAQKVEFNGGYLYSNELSHQDLLTEKPWVRMMKSKDTLYLRADTLLHFRDTANTTLRIAGRHNVKFFQVKIQGKADSLHYDKVTGIMDMWGDPYFWSNNSELHGDSIRAYVKNDTVIEKVHLRFNAFAANEIDSGKFYNQLAGKEIWAYLKDNELIRAEVLANARTIYFPEETIKTDTSTIIKRNGMNRIFAADLRVYLDSGEVTGITFIKQPEGIFFPIDQIDPKEQYLQGFSWSPALRPKTWQETIGWEPPKN